MSICAAHGFFQVVSSCSTSTLPVTDRIPRWMAGKLNRQGHYPPRAIGSEGKSPVIGQQKLPQMVIVIQEQLVRKSNRSRLSLTLW
jgi:hypothetical protein